MTKVYFCLGWDTMSGRCPILGLHQFNILISAASLWQKTGGRRLWRPKLPPHADSILDSGAFSLLTSMASYPFSFEQYLSVAEDLGMHWVAARDWPCEPYGRIQIPVPERIRRTVEADAELLETRLPNGLEPLPVIQGWEVSDYVSCIHQLRDRDLLRPRMAVGSCCGRKSTQEIMAIARAIRQELPATYLHFFGLKVTALRQPGFTELADSIDTGAWQRWVPVKERYDAEGNLHLQATAEQRMDRFYRYRQVLRPTGQLALPIADSGP